MLFKQAILLILPLPVVVSSGVEGKKVDREQESSISLNSS